MSGVCWRELLRALFCAAMQLRTFLGSLSTGAIVRWCVLARTSDPNENSVCYLALLPAASPTQGSQSLHADIPWFVTFSILVLKRSFVSGASFFWFFILRYACVFTSTIPGTFLVGIGFQIHSQALGHAGAELRRNARLTCIKPAQTASRTRAHISASADLCRAVQFYPRLPSQNSIGWLKPNSAHEIIHPGRLPQFPSNVPLTIALTKNTAKNTPSTNQVLMSYTNSDICYSNDVLDKTNLLLPSCPPLKRDNCRCN